MRTDCRTVAARADDRFRQLTPQEADDRLVGVYPRLGEMFATWGANWSRLETRFDPVASEVEFSESSVIFDAAGADVLPDAVLLAIRCASPPTTAATFAWSLAGGADQSREVPLQPGVSLVPLGAYPSWAGGPLLEITVSPDCSIDERTSPQLLRLVR